MKKFLLCLLFTALFPAAVQAAEFVLNPDYIEDETKPWEEIAASLPPYPKDENLLEFSVSSATANKFMIEAALRKLFSVTPLSTRIVNVKGKAKSMGRKGGRVAGRTSSWKKVYITLPENQKIEKFEGV